MPSNPQGANTPKAPSLHCVGCGWSVTMPIIVDPLTNEQRIDITPSTGWDIAEGKVLCERCSTGWRPIDTRSFGQRFDELMGSVPESAFVSLREDDDE